MGHTFLGLLLHNAACPTMPIHVSTRPHGSSTNDYSSLVSSQRGLILADLNTCHAKGHPVSCNSNSYEIISYKHIEMSKSYQRKCHTFLIDSNTLGSRISLFDGLN